MVGGGVRQALVHRPVDGAVRVEVARDRVHRPGPLSGGEHRGHQWRPRALPLGVVAGVRAVVEDGRAVRCPGECVGVGGVEGDVTHCLQFGVAPRAGGDRDVLAALREDGGDVSAHRAGSDDEVTSGHGFLLG